MGAIQQPADAVDIYEAEYVRRLFDEMSGSYDRVNYLTSFGFSQRWRRQCVENALIQPGETVHDLMCGMGECWRYIGRMAEDNGQVVAVDFSSGMLSGAARRKSGLTIPLALEQRDVLQSEFEDESVQRITSAFGVKTFSDEQKRILAREIHRILIPGGTYSLIEISEPSVPILRQLYMFYMKRCIPLLGRILLGNPENYRMLGVYAERFGNCRGMHRILLQAGLTAEYREYFYGCATGVTGAKPIL